MSVEMIFESLNRFLFLVKIFFILIFDKLFFIVYPVSMNNLHKYSFRCAKTITLSMFVTHRSISGCVCNKKVLWLWACYTSERVELKYLLVLIWNNIKYYCWFEWVQQGDQWNQLYVWKKRSLNAQWPHVWYYGVLLWDLIQMFGNIRSHRVDIFWYCRDE